MPVASGVAKSVRYKVESTFGTAPGASGAQLLRRVSSDIALSKDVYKSNEIRSDYQIADLRHGVRRVGGSIKGELSSKTYADFVAAALRRAFAAISAITGLTLTIAAGSTINGIATWTVTRSAGSWLSDGLKVGHVVRLSGGTLNAANINTNLLVISLTSTVATVIVLNAVAMVAQSAIASCTATITGKTTFTPTTGQLDQSFAIEHWHSDVAQSELFTGCKVGSIDVGLPATGMATVDIGFVGQNITTATSAYYTSPTALTSTGVMAAVNGVIVAGGNPIATVTGASLKIDGGYTADPVVGSNVVPNVFPGVVDVSGQLTAYFDSATLRDAFINETPISLILAFTADNTAAADFVAFVLPKIKFTGAMKDDGEKGTVQTLPFEAMIDMSGGAGQATEQTTLMVQDAQA